MGRRAPRTEAIPQAARRLSQGAVSFSPGPAMIAPDLTSSPRKRQFSHGAALSRNRI